MFFISIATAPLALLHPLPVKIVVDYAIGSEPLPAAISYPILLSSTGRETVLILIAAILLIGLALINHLITFLLQMMQARTGESILLDFRMQLFKHVQRISLKYHDSRGASESAFRIQYDAPSILALVIHGVIPIATAILTLCGIIYVTAKIDFTLALVALCISPILFFLARIYGGALKERWTSVKELESSANAVVHETLSSLRVVKAFSRETYQENKFFAESDRYKKGLVGVFFVQGGFDVLIGITIAAGMAATLMIGAMHVKEDTLSLGNLLLILGYITQVYGPLRTISSQFGVLQGAIAGAERAFNLLDEEPEVKEKDSALNIARARGHIEFEDVSFGYDQEKPVLQRISLKVPAGATVGIQGRTGAGKTSFISFLNRFYDVDEGRILLDGLDIRDYRLADYRNQFCVVLQDPVLFSTSIAENIAYGRPDAGFEDIIDAAKSAHAHEFIVGLTDGYDTIVGDRGMQLSGGERQRISLARAFLRDAPIWILDEPTSSIDSDTEREILSTLHNLTRERTTFIISHRIGSLDECDMRLEISEGLVVQI